MIGVGGFVAGRLQLALGVPMLAAWVIAGVSAGLYALVWGHPTLRLRGPYFSIATIGVGEATRLICTYWVWLTGGSSGMSLPVQVQLKYQLYWYALALALIALAASYGLRRSPLVLALLAIKSDVDAAGDVGVSSVRLQDLVLFLILFEPLGLTGLYMRVLRRARPDLGVTGTAAPESAAPATGVTPAPVEQREAK